MREIYKIPHSPLAQKYPPHLRFDGENKFCSAQNVLPSNLKEIRNSRRFKACGDGDAFWVVVNLNESDLKCEICDLENSVNLSDLTEK